jgi:hypothetical protein
MILLSQTLTSLEKQQVPYQAAAAGDDYRLDKHDPTGLSQAGPPKEEKKDKDTGYLKGNPNSNFQPEIRQCLGMILSGILKMTRMNGPVTMSSTAFLRV